MHLPREPAQHAEHRAAAPRELRVGVTADAVRLAGPFAGQAQVMAQGTKRAESVGLAAVVLDRVSSGRAFSEAAAVAVVPTGRAH